MSYKINVIGRGGDTQLFGICDDLAEAMQVCDYLTKNYPVLGAWLEDESSATTPGPSAAEGDGRCQS